ncbi:hypothetical protein STEG23_030634, partial [Scotinomys teguina]
SSKESAHLPKRQVQQKVESLTTQLQQVTTERNDLRDGLISVTDGFLDNWPYHRPNPFNGDNNMEASQKLSDLSKEKIFYRSENLQQELEQPTDQDESLLPTELLQQKH